MWIIYAASVDGATTGAAEPIVWSAAACGVVATAIPVLLAAGLLGAKALDATARFPLGSRLGYLFLIVVALLAELVALAGAVSSTCTLLPGLKISDLDDAALLLPASPVVTAAADANSQALADAACSMAATNGAATIGGLTADQANFVTWCGVLVAVIYVVIAALGHLFRAFAGGLQERRTGLALQMISGGATDPEAITKATDLPLSAVEVLTRTDLSPVDTAHALIALKDPPLNNESIAIAASLDQRIIKHLRQHPAPESDDRHRLDPPPGRLRWRIAVTLGAFVCAVVVREHDVELVKGKRE
ncbi:hypothetical protein [uncultured Cellulomonas sp.]|uniref:hypothetical protein n=1 Tax=uncultured Cellulomonas sp. TaxID=189682 RepID=UPI00260FCA45|nr:hypothetical protein [uncultured Cellulomonas sp.]